MKKGVVKLFVDQNSQPCRAVHWACLLLNVPVELHKLRIDKGELKTPEYALVHPFQKIPAMQHEGRTFIESSAILQYLCDVFDTEKKLWPADAVGRARVSEYLFWHAEFRAGLAGYFVAMMAKKDLERAEKSMLSKLEAFERVWLREGNTYVNGNTLSVADLQSANEIYQIQPFLPSDYISSRFPRTGRWLTLMAQVPHRAEAMAVWDKVAPLIVKSKL